MVKLSDAQRGMLARLSETHWYLPGERGGKNVCGALVRMGFAKRRMGFPLGWEITEAGRTALASMKGENSE